MTWHKQSIGVTRLEGEQTYSVVSGPSKMVDGIECTLREQRALLQVHHNDVIRLA